MRRAGRFFGYLALALGLAVGAASSAAAQGVTTSAISGVVRDNAGAPLAGARVTATHLPSGTSYVATSRADGRVSIPGMRVGGPYRVTVVAIGFEPMSQNDIYLSLGVQYDLAFSMRQQAVALQEVVVTAEGETVFSSERTGAATAIRQAEIQTLPTTTGRITDFTRMVPQVRGTSFAGADGRLNNITVDGAPFNNSFGLGDGQPGGRTSVAPIAMDAIEQLQINIAPYDVRQGNFVGAGINTVTKSGTNEFTGNLYYGYRNDGLVGKNAGALAFDPGTFKYTHLGFNLGGPIIQNKLFFFASYENDNLAEPATTWKANRGEAVEGSITRVLASDLETLSAFLKTNFDYDTGPFENYNNETPAKRFIGKLDFNLNDRNKFSLRYNYLDSSTDQIISNSTSAGRLGNRRTNANAMSFENAGYEQLENIRNVVGEWNAIIGGNMANNLSIGYAKHDESRGYKVPDIFPLVDIEEDGLTYTSFGFEPFTPNNELRYKSLQIVNNFTIYGEKHDWTFGAAVERYNSENVFFPQSQSVYVYNSLDDFYADANGYLANPARTTSPVTLRRFQVQWSNIPGLEKPLQPMEVTYAGIYLQDEFRATQNLKLTFGLRFDAPFFGETGFTNPEANNFTFRDQKGRNIKFQTQKLPDANLLISPRIGFNWNASGDRRTQVRGGTGVFTGRPLYVWISNQIGNNGLLTGQSQIDNTTTRPFNPDPNAYKPTTIADPPVPASSYTLATTEPDFKFPQVWRSNLAVDHRLPWGLVGTAEFLYSRDINGIYYYNANLRPTTNSFKGVDNRPLWLSGTNRIYSKISSNVVMSNSNNSYAWNAGVSLEKNFENGFFAKMAYNYGEAKNNIDPGSIASGSWTSNAHSNNPNDVGLGYSNNSPGHRFFLMASYRKEFFSFGATTLTMFYEKRTIGNASYTYSGDLNGDGSSTNDLIYIPRDKSEMNFQTYTLNASGGNPAVTFTADQQADAWEAYIAQDEYLSAHRGEYAQRGAAFMPLVNNLDLSLSQDLFTDIGGRRNKLQFRVDILNVANLINSDWGLGKRFVTTTPLTTASSNTDAFGRAQYRLRNINRELLKPQTFEQTAGINDVYRIQFSLRYTFN